MKYCPKCGFNVDPSANFCVRCGANLSKFQVKKRPRLKKMTQHIKGTTYACRLDDSFMRDDI